MIPLFAATLSRTATAGTYELVTRVAILELIRNKKGKLKINKRNIGSLLPIRLGEPQKANALGDPVTLELRVERR